MCICTNCSLSVPSVPCKSESLLVFGLRGPQRAPPEALHCASVPPPRRSHLDPSVLTSRRRWHLAHWSPTDSQGRHSLGFLSKWDQVNDGAFVAHCSEFNYRAIKRHLESSVPFSLNQEEWVKYGFCSNSMF